MPNAVEPPRRARDRVLEAVRMLALDAGELVRYARNQRGNRPRRAFVAEQIPPGGVGAEIGVFKGTFSRSLLRESAAERLHLIDPWNLLGDEWTWAPGDRSTTNALRRVRRRLRRELRSGVVRIHVGDDRRILEEFPDAYFDWVYLDSSHAYGHTCEELELLERKVRPGGLVTGDDWRPDPEHPHHGVFRAVNEFVDRGGHKLVQADADTRQWAVRLADHELRSGGGPTP